MSHQHTNLRRAYFAGSFNPFTIGHADLVDRGLCVFDEIIIGIGYNIAKPGNSTEEIKRRVDEIKRIYQNNPRVRVESYSGLTAEAARKASATALLRGVRDTRDFEYERQIADVNKQLFGLDTFLLIASQSLASISSSMVRELAAHGVDVSTFLP